ncbi:MAG: HAMP domain-containing histidine kinase, partial [Verrucomicrobia bacterium]|nr:HAMP domain-containing histidine kinase [Verrucomicrobiota bacterium]
MKDSRQRRRSTFFWQGLFILLPVLVLAVIGLLSLRQDRLLAEQEVRQRAQQIADDLAARIHDALANSSGPAANLTASTDSNCTFQMDAFGRVVDPPDYPRVPTPRALGEARLSPEQRRLWQAAQDSEFRKRDVTVAIQAYGQFIAAQPPVDLAAAKFELALLLLNAGVAGAAENVLLPLVTNTPDARLQSGLPIAPLVELKLLEQPRLAVGRFLRPAQLDAWCADAVARPTLFTPQVLAAVSRWKLQHGAPNTAARWVGIWQSQEQTRAVYRAAWEKWFAGTAPTSPVPTDTQGRPALPTVWVEVDTTQDEGDLILSSASSGGQGARRAAEEGLASARSTPAPRQERAGDRRVGPRAAAHPSLDGNLSWLPEPWLVQPLAAPGSHRVVVARPESAVRRIVNETVRAQALPAYLDASVTLFGLRVREARRSAGEWARPDAARLAPSATRILRLAENWPSAALGQRTIGAGTGAADLQVAVYLADSSAFYARQRERTEWFALLITAAAAAAIIGYVAAWRAFRRQQQLNDLKTNFVSSVSHELRAPIASVRLLAEGLERGKIAAPDKQLEYFRFIVQECRRLTALVENVLDFSRIEQGRKQYELEPTDLVALLQQTVKLMEPAAVERQVRLAVCLPDGPVSAEVDGKALQQALVNLIDNALKYSPVEGTVTVGLEGANAEVQRPK